MKLSRLVKGGKWMDNYIPEEYVEIIKSLSCIIEKYHLDEVTISGLVRGGVEVEQQLIQPVARVWRSKDGNMYTTKPSNIKVNLRFALDNAFRLKTTFLQKDIWLVLALIYMIVNLYTNATKKVDEISALILLSIYRVQKGDSVRIFEYAKKILPIESEIILTEENYQRALINLEELKCIELVDGEYQICESVDSSLYAFDE